MAQYATLDAANEEMWYTAYAESCINCLKVTTFSHIMPLNLKQIEIFTLLHSKQKFYDILTIPTNFCIVCIPYLLCITENSEMMCIPLHIHPRQHTLFATSKAAYCSISKTLYLKTAAIFLQFSVF